MNLRQKCKKLKQENERLKTRTVHVVYKEVGCKLTTIVVRREIPIFMRHEIPEKDLMEYIAREFAGNLLPYIIISFQKNIHYKYLCLASQSIRCRLYGSDSSSIFRTTSLG